MELEIVAVRFILPILFMELTLDQMLREEISGFHPLMSFLISQLKHREEKL